MTKSGDRGTKAFIRFEVVEMAPAVNAPLLLWGARAICLTTQLTSHLLKVGALNAK